MPVTSVGIFWIVFVAAFLCGCGIGSFGGMQGALVILCVPEVVKGRVLGLLSLAIASNVPGTIVFAELAEHIGTTAGLMVFGIAGVAMHFFWFSQRPQAMWIVRE